MVERFSSGESLSDIDRPHSLMIELRQGVDVVLLNQAIGLSYRFNPDSQDTTLVVDREKSEFVSFATEGRAPRIPFTDESQKGRFAGIFVRIGKILPQVYIGRDYKLTCLSASEHQLGGKALWLQVDATKPIRPISSTLQEMDPREALLKGVKNPRKSRRRG